MDIFMCSSPQVSAASIVFWVSAINCKLFCAILAFLFAVVGTTLGATAGALIALKTNKSAFLRGATTGAIMGCILSIEILRVSLANWNSDEWATGCFIHGMEISTNILKERLAGERLSSTTVHRKGLSIQIPNTRLTDRNVLHTLRNGPSCSICLQDFQMEEMVCCLPQCRHTFHPSCISEWFVRHSSCPLCRKILLMLENADQA